MALWPWRRRSTLSDLFEVRPTGVGGVEGGGNRVNRVAVPRVEKSEPLVNCSFAQQNEGVG